MRSMYKVPRSKLFVSEPDPRMFGNAANDRGNANWTNQNWLKSMFHFSFAEYNNYKNQNFGVLRVMNDDLVQPLRGFGTHGHANMEIVTYVVEGELYHKDSQGNEETLSRGAVQFMTAGTGVQHSEHNKHSSAPLRFIQSWVMPRKRGLPVKYGSFSVKDPEERRNKWLQLVSDRDGPVKAPVQISQDCNFFVTELENQATLSIEISRGRQAYLLCMEGSVQSDFGDCKEQLERHDSAELFGPAVLKLTSLAAGSHLMLVEMQEDKASSRFS